MCSCEFVPRSVLTGIVNVQLRDARDPYSCMLFVVYRNSCFGRMIDMGVVAVPNEGGYLHDGSHASHNKVKRLFLFILSAKPLC